MNKHAQNLRAVLALLPSIVCHTHRDVIYDAAAEIDRLDCELAKHPAKRRQIGCVRVDGGADCLASSCDNCANVILEETERVNPC